MMSWQSKGLGNAQPAAHSLRGIISMARSNQHRALDITIQYQGFSAEGAKLTSPITQLFSLGMK